MSNINNEYWEMQCPKCRRPMPTAPGAAGWMAPCCNTAWTLMRRTEITPKKEASSNQSYSEEWKFGVPEIPEMKDNFKQIEITNDSTETYKLSNGSEVSGADLRKRILDLKPGEKLPGFIGPGDEGF